jgi:hypothetical protein
MTGSQKPAADGDRLIAGHADREQVIEALKEALVRSRLTREALGARAPRALAALSAQTPAEPGSARPATSARRRPLARTAAGQTAIPAPRWAGAGRP